MLCILFEDVVCRISHFKSMDILERSSFTLQKHLGDGRYKYRTNITMLCCKSYRKYESFVRIFVK